MTKVSKCILNLEQQKHLMCNKVVRYIGAIDDNAQDIKAVKIKYVENAIASISAGTNPDPAVTKAIGCSIKKKS